MFGLIQQGGPIMWLLFGMGLLGGVFFLERLFHFHRAQIKNQDFLDGIYNVLKRGNVVEAVSLCEDTPGPVAHIVRAAILNVDEDPVEMSKAIQHAGLAEIPRLEHNLVMLATVAKLAPLVGLLGTVIGMMQVLITLHANAPLAHMGDLHGGLWLALLTTATGLTVAIPCYAGYNLLVSRVESLVLDMEYASAEIFSFLNRLEKNGKAARPSATPAGNDAS